MSQYNLRAIDTHVLAARLEADRLRERDEVAAAEVAAKQMIPHVPPVPLVDPAAAHKEFVLRELESVRAETAQREAQLLAELNTEASPVADAT
jgi:hypothetical protein